MTLCIQEPPCQVQPMSLCASRILVRLFLQDVRRKVAETGEPMALPITVRQLEAIIRLSESLARMQL